MKKKVSIVLIMAIPVLLVAISGTRTNPKIVHTVSWDSSETSELFYKACADCHSHETKWPWYSYVAPVSWKIINNVNEGRGEFNISIASLGEAYEAAEEVLEGEMPPREYLILHSEAKLNTEEKNAFATGLTNTFGGEGGHDDDDDH